MQVSHQLAETLGSQSIQGFEKCAAQHNQSDMITWFPHY